MAEEAYFKRHNKSLIPEEFRAAANDGDMERAALATVYGVKEYTESKIFWDNATLNFEDSITTPRDVSKAIEQYYQQYNTSAATIRPTKAPSIYNRKIKDSHDNASYTTVQPLAHTAMQASNQKVNEPNYPYYIYEHKVPLRSPRLQIDSTQGIPSLPHIPTVSEFGDLFSETKDAFKAKSGTTDAPFTIGQQILKESIAIKYTAAHQTELQPSDLSDYPFCIFDLVESDVDSRLIVWGLQNTARPSVSGTYTTINNISRDQSDKEQSGNARDCCSNEEKQNKRIRFAETFTKLAKRKSLTTIKPTKHQSHCPTTSSTAVALVKSNSNNNSGTLVIEAATIEKLIEKLTITLDYAFMTDFFLIYRVFLTPVQLCKFLISRFKWSIKNNDEKRCIVRIRTFVVLRHWLLNYFLHDFIPQKELRVLFTDFLNEMPFHPVIQQSARDQRIIKGLKRVMRRLKKVYYGTVSSSYDRGIDMSNESNWASANDDNVNTAGTTATNATAPIYVVDPTPPLYEQEIQTMIKKQLSAQHSLRQKAYNFIKRVHVDDRHFKNTTLQQKQLLGSTEKHINSRVGATAIVPVVVIGNFYSSSHLYQSSGDSNSSADSFSDGHKNGSATTIKTKSQSVVSQTSQPYDMQRKQHNKQRRRSSVACSIKSLLVGTAETTSSSHITQDIKNTANSNVEKSQQEKQQQKEQQQFDKDFAIKQWQVVQQKVERNQGFIDKINDNESQLFETNSLESIVTPGTSIIDISEPFHKAEESDEEQNNFDSSASESSNNNIDTERKAYQNANSNIGNKVYFSPYRVSTSLQSAELTEKLEKVRQEQQQQENEQALIYSVTENGRSPVIETTNCGLTNLRPRSFYTAQLAIPSDVATPDIYILTPPPITDEGKPTTEYFNMLNSGSSSQGLHFNNKIAFLSPSMTTTTSHLSLKQIEDLKFPSSIFQAANTPSNIQHDYGNRASEAIHNDHDSNTFDAEKRMSKPLPFITGSEGEEDESFEQWRLSMQDKHQSNNKTQQFSESTNGQRQQPLKSRIIELGLGSTANRTSSSPTREQQIIPPTLPPLPLAVPTATVDASSSKNKSFHIQPHLRKSIILTYPASLIAQQLCVIEKAVLLEIDWEEFVDCRWTKMPATDATLATASTTTSTPHVSTVQDQQGTKATVAQGIYSRTKRMKQQYEKEHNIPERGIEKAINRFNAVCRWVSSEIVQSSRIEDRVKVIEKFIQIAKKCKVYCNFTTLIQILLGLQSMPVSRLSKTWALVSHQNMKTLQELSVFTSPTKNWKNIRDSMTIVAEEYGESPTEIQVQIKERNNAQHLYDSNSTADANHSLKNMANSVLHRKLSTNSSKHKKKKKTQTKIYNRNMTIKLPFGGCIPFLGIYLSDLVFNAELPSFLSPSTHTEDDLKKTSANTNAGSANGTPPIDQVVFQQPLVHFRKHRITATIIKRVLIFQNLAKRYSFEPYTEDNYILYNTCLQLTSLDIDAIQKYSTLIEPCINNTHKPARQ
ncbi:hypothetical protein BDF20DRAFT_915646 [Mycotypha africana]|uniref:uncharacterized protein n=1 Tax=Mycotypha africana TaxID=64632 RepID=UPI002300B7F4|nr:uncharacterized protein BDF20DRAFT_915646 [Mycotypha africana]KAI8971895.1 hypothetical protein BDF20DRAFT_915646 [Mycotypha africana]